MIPTMTARIFPKVHHCSTVIDEDEVTVTTSNVGNPSHCHRHKPSRVSRQGAWNSIFQHNSPSHRNNAHIIDKDREVPHVIDMAISDSGATGHFLVEGAPAINIQPANKPIQIVLPNGKSIRSTHTCNLNILWLPSHMTEAHIVPGLSHSSLISTRKFCDAGCTVVFDEQECCVYRDNKLVLIGDRDPNTQLWRLPINPKSNPSTSQIPQHLGLQLLPHQRIAHFEYNVYTILHN